MIRPGRAHLRASEDGRRWLAAGTVAVSLAALVLLGGAVHDGPTYLDAVDESAAGFRGTAIGFVVLGAADLVGSLPVWAALVLALAIAMASGSLAASVRLVALMIAAEMASTAVKVVVDRPRPLGAESLDLLVSSGFPSGHVTRTAVAVGGLLVLVPWCRRHPKPVIGIGFGAIVIMGIARVSGRAHHTTDVLGACLLAAALLGLWYVVDTSARSAKPVGRDATLHRAGVLAAIPLVLSLLSPVAAWAASPSPDAGSAGDPRSSGEGPGFVGDPQTAILVTVAIGLASLVITTIYVRLTSRGRSNDT